MGEWMGGWLVYLLGRWIVCQKIGFCSFFISKACHRLVKISLDIFTLHL